MEITGSALTALFVALVLTLIKVVEYFINNKKKTNAQDALEGVLNEIGSMRNFLTEINKQGNIIEGQKIIIENMNTLIEKMGELHFVYDDNHVPKWYVPSELLPLVRETQMALTSLIKELEEDFNDMKRGQSLLAEKMIELITSQKIMAERIGDFVMKLNKLVD